MDIYLIPPIEHSISVTTQIARQFTEQRLRYFMVSLTILYEPDQTVTEINNDIDAVTTYYTVCGNAKDPCPFVGRLVINKYKLRAKYLSIVNVYEAIQLHVSDKAEVISTQPTSDEWVIRIRLNKMATIDKINSVVEEERNEIYREITHEFCDGIIDDVRISGLAKCTSFVAPYSKIEPDTNMSHGNNYMIETSGSHLRKILSSGNLIDCTRTISNNVHEILDCLGIEAAQTMIFREALDVLCDGGDYMAPEHLWLLSLKMTYTGEAQPVTRHGMIKTGQTTIVKASFERTVDTFIDAALFGKKDRCAGVTESIVTGRLAPVGTGCNIDLYENEIHIEQTRKNISDEEFIGRRRKRWKEKETHRPIYDFTMCPRERFKLFSLRNTMQRATTPPPNIGMSENFSAQHQYVPLDDEHQPRTPSPIIEEGDWEPQTPPCTPTVSEDEGGGEDDPHEGTATSPLYVPSSPISSMEIEINHTDTWDVTLSSPHYITVCNSSIDWDIRMESPTFE